MSVRAGNQLWTATRIVGIISRVPAWPAVVHGILQSVRARARAPRYAPGRWHASQSTACGARSASPGLFATAYGNVGSSIYYALGLVAAHALGLTPLVFLFAGGLFALTAKTYAEGAAMFPEAGGSSSFARHAFNDVVSFFAGWALSLDYILTIAISAFFVPHYLSAFPGLGALNHNPDDIFGGLIVVGAAGLAEHPRAGRVGQAQLRPCDPRPAARRSCSSRVGAVLVLNPSLLIHQVHLGSRCRAGAN